MMMLGWVLILVIGAFLGMLGAGGGVFLLPVLQFFFGMDPILVTSYSLWMIGLSALGGFLFSSVKVPIPLFLPLIGASLTSMLITRGWILPLAESFLPGIISQIVTIMMVLMLLLAAKSFWSPWYHFFDCRPVERQWAVGATLGLLLGFSGLGGGFIMMPLLTEGVGLSFQQAKRGSLLFITLHGMTAGIADYYRDAAVDHTLLLKLVLAMALGAGFGTYLSPRIDPTKLRRLLALLLVAAALSLLSSLR